MMNVKSLDRYCSKCGKWEDLPMMELNEKWLCQECYKLELVKEKIIQLKQLEPSLTKIEIYDMLADDMPRYTDITKATLSDYNMPSGEWIREVNRAIDMRHEKFNEIWNEIEEDIC